jgi:peroxiredoxin
MKLFYAALITLFFSVSAFSQKIEDVKGLKVGDKAPDFSGKDQNGKEIKLSEQLMQGPVVLIFYRGNWCPYCNKILKKTEDSLQFINTKGASVITVTPEMEAEVKKMIGKTKASYSLISDNSAGIMKSYDVAFQLDDKTIEKYKGYGIDLAKNNGTNGTYLPVPATYIIGKDGIIKFAYFNKDYRERVNVKDLLDNL